MSGGSYDYLCYRVSDAAGEIVSRRDTPQRRAFADLLRRVGDALHDIEWVDSGDKMPGDENAAILACIYRADLIDAAREKLDGAMRDARAVLGELDGAKR